MAEKKIDEKMILEWHLLRMADEILEAAVAKDEMTTSDWQSVQMAIIMKYARALQFKQ